MFVLDGLNVELGDFSRLFKRHCCAEWQRFQKPDGTWGTWIWRTSRDYGRCDKETWIWKAKQWVVFRLVKYDWRGDSEKRMIFCPQCGQRLLSELDAERAKEEAGREEQQRRKQQWKEREAQITSGRYFEVDRPALGFVVCSDPNCPCDEDSLDTGSGYLWISKDLVEFRRKLPRTNDVRRNVKGSLIMFGPGTATPIAMCQQAAIKRGIDLAIAGEDFDHWYQTGLVPLRPTPLARKTLSANAGPPRFQNNVAGNTNEQSQGLGEKPLQFTCPMCGTVLCAPASAIDMKGKCKKCQQVFRVRDRIQIN